MDLCGIVFYGFGILDLAECSLIVAKVYRYFVDNVVIFG